MNYLQKKIVSLPRGFDFDVPDLEIDGFVEYYDRDFDFSGKTKVYTLVIYLPSYFEYDNRWPQDRVEFLGNVSVHAAHDIEKLAKSYAVTIFKYNQHELAKESNLQFVLLANGIPCDQEYYYPPEGDEDKDELLSCLDIFKNAYENELRYIYRAQKKDQDEKRRVEAERLEKEREANRIKKEAETKEKELKEYRRLKEKYG